MKKWLVVPSIVTENSSKLLAVVKDGDFKFAKKHCKCLYGEDVEVQGKYLTKVCSATDLKNDTSAFAKIAQYKCKGVYIAYVNLAICYDNGIGTEKNMDLAAYFYSLADLQMKLDKGELDIAEKYQDELTTVLDLDVKDEVSAYQKFAELGYPAACYKAGTCLIAGDDSDPESANKYFRIAGKAGYLEGYVALGESYFKGRGVAVNKQAACDIWNEAYKLGSNEAGYKYSMTMKELQNRDEYYRVLAELCKKCYEPALQYARSILEN